MTADDIETALRPAYLSVFRIPAGPGACDHFVITSHDGLISQFSICGATLVLQEATPELQERLTELLTE